jgi:Nuclease-related domain
MYQSGQDPTAHAPGQHARSIVRRLSLRTLVALGVLAVATALLGRTFGLHDPRFIGAEIALLIAIFTVMRFVLPLVERHDRGAAGEEQVGGLLDGLREHGWCVIHDASIGSGNVDHILIGPAGAFTVETKSHPGPVRVSRIHGATLSQAQAQRAAIERAAGLQVEPLLVYSRAWVDRPLVRRKGVRVLPMRMLGRYLERSSTKLSPAQVDRAETRLASALREHRAHGRRMRRSGPTARASRAR